MKRIGFALVAVAALLGSAAPAQATMAGEIAFETYYYELDYQTVVGHYIEYCDGSSHFYGRPGPYDQSYSYTCP